MRLSASATWKLLSTEQQERLSRLGVKPAQAPSPAPAAGRATKGTKAQQAFQRGLAAFAQYIVQEGKTVVRRAHVEQLPDGSAIKLGVFLSNQEARLDRLDAQQRAALAELGYAWAAEPEVETTVRARSETVGPITGRKPRSTKSLFVCCRREPRAGRAMQRTAEQTCPCTEPTELTHRNRRTHGTVKVLAPGLACEGCDRAGRGRLRATGRTG
ncbi:hypothetical protein WJ438_04200 [Streptomyces sp. GD-15H]|uniref:hypothetical protein n=1 Tax=Streptomyces sp. GD-15H TaxID=3129112 RepID=UPI00324A2195